MWSGVLIPANITARLSADRYHAGILHRRVSSCSLVGLALLLACSETPAPTPEPSATAPELPTDWSNYRGNSALQGVASGALADRPVLSWTYETGGAITSSPVVQGATVYVGSDDGSVHAVDLLTGEPRWAFATEDIIEAPPLLHEGNLYVGSSDFFFYALDAASGTLLWKREMGDKILGGANWVRLEDGSTCIIVGCYDNNLYGLNAADGEVRWTYATDNYVNGTPAILGDKVVFGGCDAVLHVVSASTGEGLDAVALGNEAHVAGSVALADGRAYFGHYGNEFVCVHLDQGEVLWTYPSPSHAFFSSPAIGRDRVVFGGRDRKLHCVARGDGAPLWTYTTKRKVDGSPVICGDKVVFGSGDGRLYMVRLRDGAEVWKYEIGQSIFSSPAVAAGRIVVGSYDGKLYAFEAAPP